MGWSEYTVNKGLVKKGSRIDHTFVYDGDRDILSITPLCNCLKLNRFGNTLNVKWLISRKTANQSKMIEVKYKDGHREYLIIKVQVINETN